MRLPADCTLTYNGVTFPPQIHCKVRTVPEYDETGRRVKYRTHHFTVETVFVATDLEPGSEGLTMDNVFASLRFKLTDNAKPFYYTRSGFGTITADSTNDLHFGPKPGVVMWEPIGSENAVRVVWECSVCILDRSPDATYDKPNFTDIGQSSFAVDFGIDHHGNATRTITGVLEAYIPFTQNDRTHVQNTPDILRQYIDFPLLEGFRRTQHYSISADRKTIRFSISDVEIPSDNPYAPGVVECNVHHRVAFCPIKGNADWKQCSLHGSITVAPNVPRAWAWVVFVAIVKSRLGWALNTTQTGSGSVPLSPSKPSSDDEGNPVLTVPQTTDYTPEGEKDKTVGANAVTVDFLPDNLEIDEEIFGRTVTFTFQYRILAHLRDLFQRTGLFKPLKNLDWHFWTLSLVNTYGKRGQLGMSHLPTDDILLTFYDQAQPLSQNQSTGIKPDQVDFTKVFTMDKPAPEKSWVGLKVDVNFVEESNNVFHAPLYSSDSTPSPDDNNKSVETEFKEGTFTGRPKVAGDDVQVQTRGPKTYLVTVHVRGERLGHGIPTPVFSSQASMELLEQGGTPCHAVYHYGDVPLYAMDYYAKLRVTSTNGQPVSLDVNGQYFKPDR